MTLTQHATDHCIGKAKGEHHSFDAQLKTPQLVDVTYKTGFPQH